MWQTTNHRRSPTPQSPACGSCSKTPNLLTYFLMSQFGLQSNSGQRYLCPCVCCTSVFRLLPFPFAIAITTSRDATARRCIATQHVLSNVYISLTDTHSCQPAVCLHTCLPSCLPACLLHADKLTDRQTNKQTD